jgi:hypothetical protein
MIRYTTFLISISLLLSTCSTSRQPTVDTFLSPTSYPSPSITEYFPLAKGAYWVYTGKVKWTLPNNTGIAEKEITWKMEVDRVLQRNAITGYKMVGAPWDLAWYEEGKTPSNYAIIQAGGRFYKTSVEAFWRLLNEDDYLRSLVDENNLILDIPLMVGKKFCDTLSIARPDGMYCWTVFDVNPFAALGVTGVDPSSTLPEYTIGNQTMPDHSRIYFVPGVGITGYEYGHHGTVSEADVRLSEYHPGTK